MGKGLLYALAFATATPLQAQNKIQMENQRASECMQARTLYSSSRNMEERNSLLAENVFRPCDRSTRYQLANVDSSLTNWLARRESDSLLLQQGDVYVFRVRRRVQATTDTTGIQGPQIINTRTTLAVTTEDAFSLIPIGTSWVSVAASCYGNCKPQLERLNNTLLYYLNSRGINIQSISQATRSVIDAAAQARTRSSSGRRNNHT